MFGFFSSKKKPTAESDGSSDTKSSSADDEYVVITKKINAEDNIYPNLAGGALPYQVQPLPSGSVGPSTSASALPHTEIAALSIPQSNPLDNVPFKLASVLDTTSSGWSDAETSTMMSLLTRVSHLNETAFKYDFSLEESVIREANHG